MAERSRGRRGSRANGPSRGLAQRGRVAYAFLRISRRTKSISGVSIYRFHVVHAYRWNTKLPMVATCVPALPCPSDPWVCKPVRACVCMRCVGLCGRYSAWTAVSFGISALPALRTALLLPLAATRYGSTPVSTQSTPAARSPHRAAAAARRHPVRQPLHRMGRGRNGLTPCRIFTTNRARPVPDL